MHEATTAGSESNGHTASGGDAMVISSRIEIMTGGYRQLLEFVDVFMGRRLASPARAAVEVNCLARGLWPAVRRGSGRGRVLMWDERATMQRGVGHYRPDERRVMLRTIVYPN
jgi:hypothetical protein